MDDTVADWEASTFAGEFLGVRRRRSLSCLAKGKKVKQHINLLDFCYPGLLMHKWPRFPDRSQKLN